MTGRPYRVLYFRSLSAFARVARRAARWRSRLARRRCAARSRLTRAERIESNNGSLNRWLALPCVHLIVRQKIEGAHL
jgi:hypothetical protein